MIPDALVRWAIRQALRKQIARRQRAAEDRGLQEQLRSPQICATGAPFHEPAPEFFQLTFGRHLKYSSGYWKEGISSLDDAEAAMLELYCERAQLEDGQSVLDLGCGLGAFALYAAQRYPRSVITATSDSTAQCAFVEREAARRGLNNVRTLVARLDELAPSAAFDRVLAVDLLEFVTGYAEFLRRVASWLRPQGLLFVDKYTHREGSYFYDLRDVSAGPRGSTLCCIMPADDLLTQFQEDLRLVGEWRVDGNHYARTAEAWLANLEAHRQEARRRLAANSGDDDFAAYQRWRLEWMTTAELFATNNGEQWRVSHFLMQKG